MQHENDTLANNQWFESDIKFNQLYPRHIANLDSRHWTPLNVAKKAGKYLAAEKGARVLDIGSGVGKFCLTAAFYNPKAIFYGIEQRKELVDHANKAKQTLGLENVHFITANLTDIKLTDYEHFYFYNSFYENLVETDHIDNNIWHSERLYEKYNRNLYVQMKKLGTGTRIASFHSLEEDMPNGFHLIGSEIEDLLKFWIKI